MSNNKMLVDATHPEETRVVVLRNGRVEEFDYESAARKLLRGNIYLAKVTRVEPSLQAAFVDYGGNRHGFLAFNEIHPDYYQIPMADRQALLDEEAAAEAREEAEADARAERLERRRGRRRSGEERQSAPEREAREDASDPGYDEDDSARESPNDEGPETVALSVAGEAGDTLVEEFNEPVDEPETVGGFEGQIEAAESGQADDDGGEDEGEEPRREAEESFSPAESNATDGNGAPHDVGLVESQGVEVVPATPAEAEAVEQVGAEDALEELPSRPRRRPRSYKIQEVIKRRQIILVQVVKEERGTKGAALTTYLSLAGRYTVLMPNTARGGGISRKITNPQDRKRLKAIAAELEVPEGMGLIIRTAGAARTKQEIKRDFEYLLRLWESVRELTLQSTAPSLVYEEGNLIKRSIRDLFNKDVEEIVVAGDAAYNEARDFMQMLLPSHAKNVIRHTDPEPLFTRYGIERQLNAMFSPYVTLRSGGYLVINQTEALVAIDVNSGKATREFSIEETAHQTNLEAADEIARQLKLRDLAGLIVIDFIDMEEKRNNRSVERRLKDALRFDRARIQLGHISHFGLMEMSRQRLRTGVLEGSTSQCPHCQGTGIIRSTESVALAVLRGLEDALMAGTRTSLVATTTAQVALYILNNKRQFINDMEDRHGISIAVQASDKLQGANFTIEKGHAAPQPSRRPERAAVNMDWGFEGEGGGEPEAEEIEAESYGEDGEDREATRGDRREELRGEGEAGDGQRRRRRRRRGRRGNGERSEGRRGPNDRFDDSRDARRPRDDAGTSAQPFDDDQPGGEAAELDETAETGSAYSGEAAPEGDDLEYGGGRDETRESRSEGADGDRGGRRRRRGRRGGRRGRDRAEQPAHDDSGSMAAEDSGEPVRHRKSSAAGDDAEEQADRGAEPTGDHPGQARAEAADKPAKLSDKGAAAVATAMPEGQSHIPQEPAPPKARGRNAATASEPKLERVVVGTESPEARPEAPPAEPRRGWWQRKLGL